MCSSSESFSSHSTEETLALGQELASQLSGGDIVLLTGPLGAGKSVIARGIAQALGASRWRGSPTFNLVHEYETSPRLFHADLYRLTGEEVEGIGIEEYIRLDSVLVVEWADRAPGKLSRLTGGKTVSVDLSHAGVDERRIVIVRDADRESRGEESASC